MTLISLLQVVRIETLYSEKAACTFKKVTFKGVKFLGTRQVSTNVEAIRNLWPAHEATLKDGTKTTIKGDAEYDSIMVNDLLEGEIKSYPTTPYLLNGREITTWKGVVFSYENGLAVCARNLREHNAAPVDVESGEVYRLPATNPMVNGGGSTSTGMRVVHGELTA